MAQIDNLKDLDQPVLWYWTQSLVYSISIASISFTKTYEMQLMNLSWFACLLSPGLNHWHFLAGSKFMSRILYGCISESPGKNSYVSFAFFNLHSKLRIKTKVNIAFLTLFGKEKSNQLTNTTEYVLLSEEIKYRSCTC